MGDRLLKGSFKCLKVNWKLWGERFLTAHYRIRSGRSQLWTFFNISPDVESSHLVASRSERQFYLVQVRCVYGKLAGYPPTLTAYPSSDSCQLELDHLQTYSCFKHLPTLAHSCALFPSISPCDSQKLGFKETANPLPKLAIKILHQTLCILQLSYACRFRCDVELS